MKSDNNSPGSFYVGQNLPEQYKRIGKVEGELALLIKGEAAPRKVSFVMGSPSKGWFLTSRGTGPLPTGPTEYDLIQERARVVEGEEEVDEPPASRH